MKPGGAFRHTEYAKGFYKVSKELDTSGRSSITGEVGFSEAERSNVLDNQSRRPLGAKLISHASKKKGESQTRRTGQAMGNESEISKFNSTQDTAWYTNNQGGPAQGRGQRKASEN